MGNAVTAYWRDPRQIAVRHALRREKGRPALRIVYQQFLYRDGKLVGSVKSVAPDPILNLYPMRANCVYRGISDTQRAANAISYGEIRQLVVSPLDRPLP